MSILTCIPRKHLFTDLRPYVCTFEECDLKLFADRHLWFDHEVECHRSVWQCRFCEHPPFRKDTALKSHMSLIHPNLSSSIQLPSVLQASRERPDRITAADCLFCDWEVILKDFNSHTAVDEMLVVTPEQFRRHLGSHMEQLALFALPRSYKDEDVDAASDKAAAIIDSDSLSRNSSRNRPLSWKTVSDHGVKQDQAVPDLAPIPKISDSSNSLPDVTPDPKSQYPWSRRKLKSNGVGEAFPRYGASVNGLCTNEGAIYIYGGLVNGTTIKGDLWVIDTSQEEVIYCEPLSSTVEGPSSRPSSRVGAAAVLAGNAFIVFGGDTKKDDNDTLDKALYLLNTCKTFSFFLNIQLKISSYQTLVQVYAWRCAFRKVRSYFDPDGLTFSGVWWST